MSDWNPDLYMQFKSERTQPSIDLISKIPLADPKTIIDIGCGPGNSTQALVLRWPNANITGLDSSASMIRKAREDYPDQQWVVADGSTYNPESEFGLVFSNAAIQWMLDHTQLLKQLHGLLSENGVLAVQIPQFWDMPLGKIIADVADDERWRERTKGVTDMFTINDCGFYYDNLSYLFASVDIWQTDYMHILESHQSILEMMRSTGLKPYLERLESEPDKQAFEASVLQDVAASYPVQKNGKVILPFKRLFFIACR